jgi:hypothetical protein
VIRCHRWQTMASNNRGFERRVAESNRYPWQDPALSPSKIEHTSAHLFSIGSRFNLTTQFRSISSKGFGSIAG